MNYLYQDKFYRNIFTMKRFTFLFLYLSVVLPLFSQNVEVSCGGLPAYRFTEGLSSMGLEGVYVVYQASGSEKAEIIFDTSSSSPVTWYRFGRTGLDDKVLIDGITDPRLAGASGDCGYEIMQDGRSVYIWLINYLDYPLTLRSINAEQGLSDPCSSVRLLIDGTGDDLPFYSVSGRYKGIHRIFTIDYNTLEWNDADELFAEIPVKEEMNSGLLPAVEIQAPYAITTFTLSGDQFLTSWGMTEKVVSAEYDSPAPVCKGIAEQYTRDNKNEWDREQPTDGTFGGSAPVEMTFYAYYNDVVTHSDWQFSKDKDFITIDAHYYNSDEFHYTFNQEGTTYVRLMVSNGACRDSSDVFQITVGESRLEAPNIFSPGTTPGVNDEWKVAYKSIVSFKCWIFNRWGVELFHFEDPAQGWDGKYHGKLVDPGVYFYVIEAKGADNRKHNLKGNINILRAKD